jgi:hypothetical protein
MGVNPMIQRNLMLAGLIVFMLGLGGTGVIASSLPFIRDRMRVHYRLEVPPFYDSLPADWRKIGSELSSCLKQTTNSKPI